MRGRYFTARLHEHACAAGGGLDLQCPGLLAERQQAAGHQQNAGRNQPEPNEIACRCLLNLSELFDVTFML